MHGIISLCACSPRKQWDLVCEKVKKYRERPWESFEDYYRSNCFEILGWGVALDAFKHVFLYFVQTFVCADAYCYSVVVSVNEASNDSVPSSPLSPDNLSFRAHSMKRKYSRRKRPDDTVAWGECFDLQWWLPAHLWIISVVIVELN